MHSYIKEDSEPKLGGVAAVAYCINGHEQTNKTDSTIFVSLAYSLLPRGLFGTWLDRLPVPIGIAAPVNSNYCYLKVNYMGSENLL